MGKLHPWFISRSLYQWRGLKIFWTSWCTSGLGVVVAEWIYFKWIYPWWMPGTSHLNCFLGLILNFIVFDETQKGYKTCFVPRTLLYDTRQISSLCQLDIVVIHAYGNDFMRGDWCMAGFTTVLDESNQTWDSVTRQGNCWGKFKLPSALKTFLEQIFKKIQLKINPTTRPVLAK
jgi:hypothetical protein